VEISSIISSIHLTSFVFCRSRSQPME